MITIPMLTEKDLDVFKGKKVLLYGVTVEAELLYRVFRHFNIEVIGYCIEETVVSKQKKVEHHLMGLHYIEVVDLINTLTKYDNLIVQRTDFDAARLMSVEEKMKKLGLSCSPFTRGELAVSFPYAVMAKHFKSPFFYPYRLIRRKLSRNNKQVAGWNAFQQLRPRQPIVICAPAKTADYALDYTFERLNQKSVAEKRECLIDSFNVWHRPTCINRAECEKCFGTLKILVGIREPISQNISVLYQMISAGDSIDSFIWAEIESGQRKRDVVNKYTNRFGENGNDVQKFWDIYTGIYAKLMPFLNKRKEYFGFIQWFMVLFKEHILDITAYPFDKEKGYAIIKEGNTEVFVYQLEKLNSLVPELSTWVGVPFDKLEKGNEANDKWIAESYKQAKKEIKITQEYFDKCFDEPYVKHCYSEADIEKFKARWRSHVV